MTLRVLHLEDNPDDAFLIKKSLAQVLDPTIELEQVDHLGAALKRLAQGGIDLVLSDLKLPDSTGLDTFRSLRAHAPHTPVILLTGTFGETQLALEALQQGAQDYLFKHDMTTALLERSVRYAVERKRAEEALREANTRLQELAVLKDELVANVSHELRTPLAITREGISLMLDEVAGPTTDKQKKVLITAQSNIDRLARMINDLLDMSKLEAGKVRLKRARVDLVACVKDVLATFESQATAKGVALRADVPTQEATVYADADKLTQVLTNLIGNALKFTERGHITISVSEGPEDIICKVQDSGKGIAKEHLPEVFSKFQQFGRVAGAGEKGTGLGLAITKGLIELHGGVIQVESEVNTGTTFMFTLPTYSIEALLERQVKDGIQEAVENSSRMSLLLVTCAPESVESVVDHLQALIKSGLCRKDDTTIRTPEGVAVLLPDCDQMGVLSVKTRLVPTIQDWIVHEPMTEGMTLDVGCATYPDDAKGMKELIAWAQQGTTKLNGADTTPSAKRITGAHAL